MKVESYPIASREEWLARRRGDATASDIAAICGLSPYKSPAQVYYEKRGLVGDVADNVMMRQGRWFEPAVAVALSEEFPHLHVTKCNIYLREPTLRIGATPDFIADDPAIDGSGNIQAKIVESPIFVNEWLDGDDVIVPLHYQLQTMVEAKLMGATWAAVAVLVHASFGRSEIKLIRVPIHEGAWERVCDTVAAFWQGVTAGVEPPADPARDEDIVKLLYPTDNNLTIDLPESVIATVDRLDQVKGEIKRREDEKVTLETTLKMTMGQNSYGRLPDGRCVSWRLQHRSAFHMPEADFRVLRVLKAKGKNIR